MRYEISSNNEVSLYNIGTLAPFQFQPNYPNGDSFDTPAEAETWAQLAIASFDPTQPFAPDGKGLLGKPKKPPMPTDGLMYSWDESALAWTEMK